MTSTLTLLPVETENARAAWCERITESWRESVLAIVETGRLLIAAKDALDHGEWLVMFEARELPFGARMAQMLMRIAASPRLANPQCIALLPPAVGTIYDVVVLPDDEFEARLADGTICPEMIRDDLKPETEPLFAGPMSDAEAGAGDSERGPAAADTRMVKDREPQGELQLPGDHRATMAGRQEPSESLDFFPTGPWITRSLMERVMPHLGVTRAQMRLLNAWEPAAGEGHIAEVLREYFGRVDIGDIHDYGYRVDPADAGVGSFVQHDFLDYEDAGDADWIITNPPFGDKLDPFIAHALNLAKVGVAIFAQVRIAEGLGRYELFYRDNPPTVCAFFVERAACIKGEWDPRNSTATAYWWLVWIKGQAPRPPFWIPPGCREALTRPDDVERFTQHPVRAAPARVIEADIAMPDPAIALADAQARQRGENLDGSVRRETAEAAPPAPVAETAELAAAEDDFEIPAFLRRNERNEVPSHDARPAEHTFTLSIDWKGAGPDNLGTDVATCTCGKELRVARGATPEENAVAREKLAEMMDAHRAALSSEVAA